MTRIVATSDLHGHLPSIPPCDLLILGGDICPNGSPKDQQGWLDNPFRKWLDTVPAKEVVAIAGNHDFIFADKMDLVPKDLRWHYLQDNLIRLYNLTIYGSPWQLPFYGVFNMPDKLLPPYYAKVPKKVDIFINHGAPFGILDSLPCLLPEDEIAPLHTGSISLREKVFEIGPKLCIFGHIHGGFGKIVQHGITFANVSLLNDDMEVTNHPVIFDF
jgi:Icc-related predicted phosphoesterase